MTTAKNIQNVKFVSTSVSGLKLYSEFKYQNCILCKEVTHQIFLWIRKLLLRQCERSIYLTIFLDNFSTSFRCNSTRKIGRWFEEFINLNHHFAIFIAEFHQKLVEKLFKKFSYLSRTHGCSVGMLP